MNLLLAANCFPPVVGGASVVYENLCRVLQKEISVLTAWRHSGSGQEIAGWRETDASLPCEVRRIEAMRTAPVRRAGVWSRAGGWLAERRLRGRVLAAARRMVVELQPNAFCVGDLYSLSWLGLALRREYGLPLIVYAHGDDVSRWTTSRLYSREARNAIGSGEAVIAVSSFAKRRLVEFGALEDRVRVLTNGVDAERFRPAPRDEKLLARHGAADQKVLLTVTRLEERKGVDIALRALPRILEVEPETHYLIVGDGSQRTRLERLTAELGLGGRVTFLGALPHESPELLGYYQSCDLFLMPNRQLSSGEAEGFGLVFMEASACGKPVIGGRSGGAVDAVRDGVTGLLVDGSAPEEVANAALRILGDARLAGRFGESGRTAAEQASWPRKVMEFREICEDAIRLARPVH